MIKCGEQMQAWRAGPTSVKGEENGTGRAREHNLEMMSGWLSAGAKITRGRKKWLGQKWSSS